MDSAAAVLSILIKLQSLGFCAVLRIPDDAAASDPSEEFDAVLAAFLREAYPGGREARPLLAALGDGRRVDLLRIFLAIRAAGGYAALSSSPVGGGWPDAAESAGLDADLAAPVKLLYAKYLGALERWIQRLVEAHGPFLDIYGRKNQELFVGANGVGKEESFLNCNEREQHHMMLKRKMEDMVGMLDWVREIAENAHDGGAVAAGSANGYYSMALAVREAVIRKRAHWGSMTKGVHLQEIFPMACKCCMSPTSFRFCAKAKCTEKLQLMVHRPDSDISELTTVVQNKNGSLMVIGQESLAGHGEHESRMQHNCSDGCLFTSQQRNEIPVGPDYQAHVPQWTDELSVNYDDPETLKWLGTKVWPPGSENRKALFCGDPIGKGREVVCGCNLPGSVECVRFHVAERSIKLKRELGTAFYAWRFYRMGEEMHFLGQMKRRQVSRL